MLPQLQLLVGACPECGAGYGERHWPGCAAAAGALAATARERDRSPDLEAAIVECRRRGWATVRVPGEGWRPCAADEPGACVDLARHAFWREHGDALLHGADAPRTRSG
jgi:hypothetical protein